MNERFRYYFLKGCVFVYDTSSTFVVFYKGGGWNEECNMSLKDFASAKVLTEQEALEKTNGDHPLEYVEDLIEQDMLKTIYCP